MKRYILFILVFISINTYAQKSEDALRFSQKNYISSARAAAMGGAFGALGNDFYAIGINPAGLGIYRHNEFSFTTSLASINANQKKRTASGEDFNLNADITSWNLGHMNAIIVIDNENQEKGSLSGFVIGLGYRQLNNFDRESLGRADNSTSSFLDYLGIRGVSDLNNGYSTVNPFSAALFESVKLLQVDNGGYATGLKDNEIVNQTKKIIESGYQGEYEVSLAANIDRKVFFGLSVGIQQLDYRYSSAYSEQTIGNNNPDVDNFSYLQYVNQSGYGFNAKLGVIYKPIQNLSLGFAFDSGTKIKIDEEYYTTAIANYKHDVNGGTKHTAKSTVNDYSYTLSTPMKLTFSGAYIFGQRALISADIEYIDYKQAVFSKNGDEETFQGVNSESKNSYKAVWNFRIGGEYRLNSLLSLRAGYAFEDSPYQSGFINDNNYKNIFSGGLGFRVSNFFANLAYINTKYNNSYAFYNVEDKTYGTAISSQIKQKISNNEFMLSIGLNF